MKSILNYVKGGLGNQCFIYAAGRSLAHRAGSEHIIDIGFYPEDYRYKTQYQLSDFNIAVDDYRILPTRLMRRLDKRINGYCTKIPFIKKNYLFERSSPIRRFQVFPERWEGTLILSGYWQSERYFSDIKREITRELVLKDLDSYSYTPLAEQIRLASNSVFLHLRSYKDVPGKQDGSLALPISYFHNALNYIRSMIGSFDLFVFSDDIQWTKSRLKIPNGSSATFIESMGDKSKNETYRDFYLMRLCKHGIIANSSFSWWTGWLGAQDWLLQGEQTIRIRPDIYCMNDDYWPNSWISVSTV